MLDLPFVSKTSHLIVHVFPKHPTHHRCFTPPTPPEHLAHAHPTHPEPFPILNVLSGSIFVSEDSETLSGKTEIK